jgi:hypothetical protein
MFQALVIILLICMMLLYDSVGATTVYERPTLCSDTRRDEKKTISEMIGRDVAQAVSRRLPISTAQVPARLRSCGIFGGHSRTGAGFLRILHFPLPMIPPITQHSSSLIIRGWYNRPAVAAVIVDSVPLHPKKGNRMIRVQRCGFNHLSRIFRIPMYKQVKATKML